MIGIALMIYPVNAILFSVLGKGRRWIIGDWKTLTGLTQVRCTEGQEERHRIKENHEMSLYRTKSSLHGTIGEWHTLYWRLIENETKDDLTSRIHESSSVTAAGTSAGKVFCQN